MTTTPRADFTVSAHAAATGNHRIMAGSVIFPDHGRRSVTFEAVRRDGRRFGPIVVGKPAPGSRARIPALIVPAGTYQWESTDRAARSAWIDV